MRTHTTAVLALVFVAACSAPRSAQQAPARAPAQRVAAQPPAPFQGGNAITQSELPYEQLVAQTQRAGKPALLFFWTSW